MKKEVIVAISGLQFEVDQNEAVEMITGGEYFYKDGKHHVFYEEILEGFQEATKNHIVMTPDKVEMMKRGSSNTHMIFEREKQNMTQYNTPYGTLLIALNTTGILMNQEETELNVKLSYGLDVNYAHLSDCEISIRVTEKKTA